MSSFLSWDLVYWSNGKKVDYVPSIWASSSGNSYKWPTYTKNKEIKLLVDTCSELINIKYKYYKGEARKKNIKDLKEVKKLCERAILLSSSEESDTNNKTKNLIANEKGMNILSRDDDESEEETYSNAMMDTSEIFDTSCSYEPPEKNTNAPATITDQKEFKEFQQKISRKLGGLKYDITKLQKSVNEIVDILKCQLPQHVDVNFQNGRDEVTVNIFEMLPLNTVEELENVEAKLEDETFKKQLIQYLYLLGGNSAHRSIYLQLGKILHPNLSVQYSGIGKKGKFAFNSLKLFSVVQDATRKRFPNTVEVDIRKSVSTFLAMTGAKEKNTKKN